MPLVLDLDGTLIAGDLLYKSFFSILRHNPLIVFSCAAWLLKGRAALKRQLALRNRIDWDRSLMVIASVITLVLAGQLASRLGFIDQLYASDGELNLKGKTKAEMLRRIFPAGFIYAGDSKADLGSPYQLAGEQGTTDVSSTTPNVRPSRSTIGIVGSALRAAA